MITLTLQLPPKELSPNSRCHYMAKANKAKKYRAAAFMVARAQPIRKAWKEATIQATFYFKQNRRRDKDNLLAMLKNAFDGIADAGVVANDSGFTHLPVQIEIDREHPRVELRISPSTVGV